MKSIFLVFTLTAACLSSPCSCRAIGLLLDGGTLVITNDLAHPITDLQAIVDIGPFHAEHKLSPVLAPGKAIRVGLKPKIPGGKHSLRVSVCYVESGVRRCDLLASDFMKRHSSLDRAKPPATPPASSPPLPLRYLFTAAVGTLTSATFFKHRSREYVALAHWGFTVFIVSTLLFIFRAAHCIPEFLFGSVGLYSRARAAFGEFGALIVDKLVTRLAFRGPDFDLFTAHVETPLFLYILTAHLAVIYYLVRPDPEGDKQWHLMRFFFGLLRGSLRWTQAAKTALLALGIKAFFLPMLASWAIHNVYFQLTLVQSFTWDFAHINRFLVALFILVDVLIFFLGYLTELPQLKNQIRSVEPTLLGWVVCLWCYPPFNAFSFVPFDQVLFPKFTGLPGTAAATAVITLLWGIYTWATWELGWRSSNLTNRGIVSSGPYAYVRHPAYLSKVLLWTLSALFLDEGTLLLMIATIVIYSLRAWTEERHLRSDPEYLDYRARVRWWVIPRVL